MKFGNLRRRTIVRIVSYGMTGLVVLAGVAAVGWIRAANYERLLVYTYQRAYSELASSVSGIEAALSKGVYANSSASLALLSSDVWRQSSEAKTYLGQLPTTGVSLDRTAKFLSQVGNYAYVLTKKSASNTPLTDEERKNLVSLSDTASTLAEELTSLAEYAKDKGFFFGDPEQGLKKLKANEQNMQGVNLAAGLSLLEEEFPETPVLIYDGPFSEHITKRIPAYLSMGDKMTEAAVKKNAAKLLGTSEGSITSAGKTVGEKGLDAYSYEFKRDGGIISVDMTQTGGFLISLMDSREASKAKLTSEQCIKKAKDFMDSAGYKNMEESYWYTSENRLFINFAYKQGDITVYPDLVQIGVAMDNGSICFVQAKGYLMNHRENRPISISMTKQAAQSRLYKGLAVQSSRLTIIPTAGENEILCYEFKCKGENGKSYLFYLSVKNGDEEKIFLLVESKNGSLTF